MSEGEAPPGKSSVIHRLWQKGLYGARHTGSRIGPGRGRRRDHAGVEPDQQARLNEEGCTLEALGKELGILRQMPTLIDGDET